MYYDIDQFLTYFETFSESSTTSTVQSRIQYYFALEKKIVNLRDTFSQERVFFITRERAIAYSPAEGITNSGKHKKSDRES